MTSWDMHNPRDLWWHVFESWARLEAWLGRRFHFTFLAD